MELFYKTDFEQVAQRWSDFWNGTNKQPLVGAVIPKKTGKITPHPDYAAGADGNFEPVIDQICAWAESHEFIGDIMPFYYLEFAADHFSALLGADLEFINKEQKGGWPVAFIDDINQTNLTFQKSGKWWERTVEFAEKLKERLGGEILIASPSLVGNLDAVVACREANELLMDLVMSPEGVKRAVEQVDVAFKEIVAAFHELFEYDKYGSITRHGMYSPGCVNVLQCDMSTMIGPEMFQEFVVPSLKKEAALLDHCEYHLDGEGAALNHLDTLIELDFIDTIQWQPGVGNAQEKDWSSLHQTIDMSGKGQLIATDNAKDLNAMEKMAALFKNKNQFYYVRGDYTKTEIEDFIAKLEQ
jgi:hypothetical protein